MIYLGTVDGSKLVVEALKAHGVTRIFTLSGTDIMSIYDVCLDAGIEIIDTRHEEAAVRAADGWGLLTGQPAVAIVTSSTGVTNACTGMANAFLSASPLVLISGASSLELSEMGPPLEMDQVALMSSITKWARTILDTKRIPEYFDMAFRNALSGRPGPVYINIPRNVLKGKVDESQPAFNGGDSVGALRRGRPNGDPELVGRALEILKGAARPLVITGSGVWWSGASNELTEFVEKANLPVLTGIMHRSPIPDDHPLHVGLSSPHLGSIAEYAASKADAVIIVGARIDFRLNYGRPPFFAPDAKIIQVDLEEVEIGRNRKVDVGIVGDAKAVLKQLINEIGPSMTARDPNWVGDLQRTYQVAREEVDRYAVSDSVPIHPARLCREIDQVLPRSSTVITDGGAIYWWAMAVMRTYYPAHLMKAAGLLGSLGGSIPVAMAAKLARPNEPVIALCGDGAFGLNGMEFDTAFRHNIPIVCVIANDGCWGQVRHRQEKLYGPERLVATKLGTAQYHKVVEALGGYAELVEEPSEIRPALERALSSGRPACLNVRTESAQSPAIAWLDSLKG